jgi:hypothetical protein
MPPRNAAALCKVKVDMDAEADVDDIGDGDGARQQHLRIDLSQFA